MDALPLSLKGALTSLGSYKRSCTSFTRPLALASVQECWFTVLFWWIFGALLVFGVWFGVWFGVLHLEYCILEYLFPRHLHCVIKVSFLSNELLPIGNSWRCIVMSKFSRKGLNSRKPCTSVLNVMILCPFKRSEVWFELILSECVRSLIWTVPLFDRTVKIPAKIWLLLTWTLPFEPLFLQPIVLRWWAYFLANDWILIKRWLDSVFPRTFISIDEMKFLHALFKLLIRTEIFHLISDF